MSEPANGWRVDARHPDAGPRPAPARPMRVASVPVNAPASAPGRRWQVTYADSGKLYRTYPTLRAAMHSAARLAGWCGERTRPGKVGEA